MKRYLSCIFLAVSLLIACHKTVEPLSGSPDAEMAGFFLLNEGNMGSNKCTLDYYDYASGIYRKNIYDERNMYVNPGLGDVGNDLALYADKLWAVINCSNQVEVMDAKTVQHIGSISIPNCRYIVFKDGYAYVSAYAGPMESDPNYRLGYVARVDIATLEVKDTCNVGYQPEEMVIAGNKLYVANSGGYRMPDYDQTVSVIDLSSFEEIKKIDVAPNLHRMELDAYGNIWVSSRGDYYDIPFKTYVISTLLDEVIECMELLPCTDMTLCGDSLYVLNNSWSHITQTAEIGYTLVNVKTHQVITRRFITDGTDAMIQNPYGLAVNPVTRELFVTDARDYITPGKVYCYTPEGRLKWSANTGDIPSRIVFTPKRLQ